MKTFAQFLQLLVLASVVASAQEVSIPDPGLNTAIRDALQKTVGPLTEQDLLSLTNLNAGGRSVRSVEGLGAAHNLTRLDLGANQLTNLTLPAGMISLTSLDLGQNPQLTNFSFLSGLTSLTGLDLNQNQQLTDFSFLSGLTNLTALGLGLNELTSLTLPADLTSLTYLEVSGNQLRTFVLPEPLAFITNLFGTAATLRSQGASVYTYPLALSLASPQRTLAGAFGFALTGPPAAYTILSSPDLTTWNQLGIVTNTLGAAVFADAGATNLPQMFYRAVSR